MGWVEGATLSAGRPYGSLSSPSFPGSPRASVFNSLVASSSNSLQILIDDLLEYEPLLRVNDVGQLTREITLVATPQRSCLAPPSIL